MPRKKRTSAESEPPPEMPAQDAAAPEKPTTEPGDDIPKPRRKTAAKKAATKPAAKKRAVGARTKKATTGSEDEPKAGAAAESLAAEASAHAADTFEDAFESNDLHEAHATTAGAESAATSAPGEAESAPREPIKEPAQEPDEAGELEGDWESGSGEEDEKPEPPPAKQERLQKILAAAGVASRRHAEEMIVAGRVQVNGQVITTLGSKADPARDHIRVDGKLIHGAERLRYFVLNKPRGYVTTVSDPEGRPTVMEFFARMRERLYPVGRLDFQSEGLLLMTNDGELANQLTRAASGVEKVYLVKIAGQPGEEQIRALREGVRIDRGKPGEGRVDTAPAHVRQIRQGDNPWFEVALIEGRNRELRKMFEEIGHHVEKIRRVGYGPLELDLEPGKMRELTPEEVQALRLAAEGKLKPKRIRASAMLPREAGRTMDAEAGKRRRERPAGGQERRRETGGAQRDFGRGRREGARPERPFKPRPEGGFEPRQAPGTGLDRAGAARGGFRPREERPGRWQDRGQSRGHAPRPGQQQDRGPQRGTGEERGRSEHPSQRRPFQPRPAFGGKPQPFGSKPQPFGGKPLRIERAGGEGRGFERGGNRGFGRTSPPAGRPPFRGKPEQDNQRPRPARPPRAEGFQDRGPRPPRFDRGSQDRPTFGRGPQPSFDRPSRPPRSAGERDTRGPAGGGERRPAPARGGGFARRGPGSGPKPGGQRFGPRPGGGSRPGGGKPHGGGGRKPGGFGKGRPR
jgi:23S rRNA pseudouridine2605 synthase